MHRLKCVNKRKISRDWKQKLQFKRQREGKPLPFGETKKVLLDSRVAIWDRGKDICSRTKRTFFYILALPLTSSGPLGKLLNMRSNFLYNEDNHRVRVKEGITKVSEIWKSLNRISAISNIQWIKDKVRQCQITKFCDVWDKHAVRGNITTYLRAVLTEPWLISKMHRDLLRLLMGRSMTYIYTHTHICIFICVCVCICTYIYIRIWDYMINHVHTVHVGWPYDHILDGEIYTWMINAWFEVRECPGRTETSSTLAAIFKHQFPEKYILVKILWKLTHTDHRAFWIFLLGPYSGLITGQLRCRALQVQAATEEINAPF